MPDSYVAVQCMRFRGQGRSSLLSRRSKDTTSGDGNMRLDIASLSMLTTLVLVAGWHADHADKCDLSRPPSSVASAHSRHRFRRFLTSWSRKAGAGCSK